MKVVARTLAAAAVGAVLVPVAAAQELDWWRETAAREAQRVREAQRGEFIRAQYERRRVDGARPDAVGRGQHPVRVDAERSGRAAVVSGAARSGHAQRDRAGHRRSA